MADLVVNPGRPGENGGGPTQDKGKGKAVETEDHDESDAEYETTGEEILDYLVDFLKKQLGISSRHPVQKALLDRVATRDQAMKGKPIPQFKHLRNPHVENVGVIADMDTVLSSLRSQPIGEDIEMEYLRQAMIAADDEDWDVDDYDPDESESEGEKDPAALPYVEDVVLDDQMFEDLADAAAAAAARLPSEAPLQPYKKRRIVTGELMGHTKYYMAETPDSLHPDLGDLSLGTRSFRRKSSSGTTRKSSSGSANSNSTKANRRKKRDEHGAFDLLSSIMSYNILTVEVIKHLSPHDILHLYAVSRVFHAMWNANEAYYTRVVGSHGTLGDAAKCYPWGMYKEFIIRNPKGYIVLDYIALCPEDQRPPQPPALPAKKRVNLGLNFLHMLSLRERIRRDIFACMAREGHRLPESMAWTFRKMWVVMDCGKNEDRADLMRSWSDTDLFNATLFFTKLGMVFNHPQRGPGHYDLMELMLGQPDGMRCLWQLLRKKRFTTDLLEIVTMKLMYDYRPTARQSFTQCAVMGVPYWMLGLVRREGWGKGLMELLRPDEMVAVESCRRDLELHVKIPFMMAWGYRDWKTGRQLVPTIDELYMSDDELPPATNDLNGRAGNVPLGPRDWKPHHYLRRNFDKITREEQLAVMAIEEDESLKAEAWQDYMEYGDDWDGTTAHDPEDDEDHDADDEDGSDSGDDDDLGGDDGNGGDVAGSQGTAIAHVPVHLSGNIGHFQGPLLAIPFQPSLPAVHQAPQQLGIVQAQQPGMIQVLVPQHGNHQFQQPGIVPQMGYNSNGFHAANGAHSANGYNNAGFQGNSQANGSGVGSGNQWANGSNSGFSHGNAASGQVQQPGVVPPLGYTSNGFQTAGGGTGSVNGNTGAGIQNDGTSMGGSSNQLTIHTPHDGIAHGNPANDPWYGVAPLPDPFERTRPIGMRTSQGHYLIARGTPATQFPYNEPTTRPDTLLDSGPSDAQPGPRFTPAEQAFLNRQLDRCRHVLGNIVDPIDRANTAMQAAGAAVTSPNGPIHEDDEYDDEGWGNGVGLEDHESDSDYSSVQYIRTVVVLDDDEDDAEQADANTTSPCASTSASASQGPSQTQPEQSDIAEGSSNAATGSSSQQANQNQADGGSQPADEDDGPDPHPHPFAAMQREQEQAEENYQPAGDLPEDFEQDRARLLDAVERYASSTSHEADNREEETPGAAGASAGPSVSSLHNSSANQEATSSSSDATPSIATNTVTPTNSDRDTDEDGAGEGTGEGSGEAATGATNEEPTVLAHNGTRFTMAQLHLARHHFQLEQRHFTALFESDRARYGHLVPYLHQLNSLQSGINALERELNQSLVPPGQPFPGMLTNIPVNPEAMHAYAVSAQLTAHINAVLERAERMRVKVAAAEKKKQDEQDEQDDEHGANGGANDDAAGDVDGAASPISSSGGSSDEEESEQLFSQPKVPPRRERLDHIGFPWPEGHVPVPHDHSAQVPDLTHPNYVFSEPDEPGDGAWHFKMF